ncbi:uncharacterized protein LOC126783108 [Argentina anserina]|uniref:uncharacterized protein LOC126783108 n=1 Tax=Argentina anserina TaxID=57926 RepID=UPI0021767466|nr:uncharacterized protein LOC126783108 [Potentilla anserina]XP_050364467.1 uncharacterized protein LOC126783108 [Potentilla anserina]
MGKREKQASKFRWDELSEGEEELATRKDRKTLKSVVQISSDEDEANEDLSLKIVEKALRMRKARLATENDSIASDTGGLVGLLSSSSSQVSEVEAPVLETKKVVKKDRVGKSKKRKVEDPTVNFAIEEVKVDEDRAVDETIELKNGQITDNIVLRKLLRGPRYFDPPDKSWGACFNCGEEGHAAVNCTVAKRKKPCFVCGSLEHNAKQCGKGQDCFICKKGGHHAKNCPEKYNVSSLTSKICLRCGDSGHEMYLCRKDYPSDDLKEIQCYVCKTFGHLCCVKCDDNSRKEISCYKCGQLGHTGMACIGLRGGEATVSESPRLCYKCGEGGHFARECRTSNNARKRYGEFSNASTPTLRPHKEKKDYMGFYSAPNDLKRKHTHYDERGFATPQKAKHRGGWIVDDPDDFSPRKGQKNGWKSPVTPSSRSHRISSSAASGHASSSRSSKKSWKASEGPSTSQGSYRPVQHRYSAQRFDNSVTDGYRRNSEWW